MKDFVPVMPLNSDMYQNKYSGRLVLVILKLLEREFKDSKIISQ